MTEVWRMSKRCACSYCEPRGGENKHAWAFFYFLKRCGDAPRVEVTNSEIVVTVF